MQKNPEDALRAELARLPLLSHAELQAKWLELYGKPLKGARRDLLIRGIAYRLQAQIYGGLPTRVKRRLRQLRAAFLRDPAYQPGGRIDLHPGTRLVREWRGERHEVTILAEGFSYRDRTFDNLSEIARTITGTRWSGPLFFGLTSAGKGLASPKVGRPKPGPKQHPSKSGDPRQSL